MKHFFSKFARNAFSGCVVFRASIMAAVVGTVLIIINHGECAMKGMFTGMCFFQCMLTFLVPYFVSTISSVLAMCDAEKNPDKQRSC